jgi:arylsulfatase A
MTTRCTLCLKRLFGLLLVLGASQLNAARPTNFIQILTDDQGWGDLGSYGHKLLKTPHIDQLAADGMKFSHCYSSAGVCSPSRAAILTGRTPYRNGVYHWINTDRELHLPASEITLPQLLREHGYQTAHFGKWHLSHYSNNGGQPPFLFGGDKTQPTMKAYGYDYWFATGNVARPSHKNPQNFFRNGKAVGPLQGYSAQLVAQEIAQWIDNTRTADKPFFMTVWFHEPHGPISSDPRFMNRYGDDADLKLKQYLGNITQIDEAVGAIVKSLEAAGITDNTLIWYTSDNGPAGDDEHNLKSNFRGSTGGLRGRKAHTHEGGIRVPGIIKWPAGLKRAGVAAGTTSEVPTVGHDILPTLLDIAGVAIPEDRVIDGTSILPVLENRPFQRNRPLYWRNRKETMRVAIRDGVWKLLCDSRRSSWQLYNLVEDPQETTDLTKSNPELFERMKAALIAYDNDVLTDGPDWWQRGSWKKTYPPDIANQQQQENNKSR